ncbi:MAG: hypothetical protein QGG36_02370, partial [Pirellulaceae bacterium]|nr:hypothetical protein [Pirellulaceae bacterium]
MIYAISFQSGLFALATQCPGLTTVRHTELNLPTQRKTHNQRLSFNGFEQAVILSSRDTSPKRERGTTALAVFPTKECG